ncbi:MAG TPA: TonB-dependent receptor, partial [Kiritimatiellia bacterium]|nr:TonB-dependent receptor [Kiritimatiellia bacterium]
DSFRRSYDEDGEFVSRGIQGPVADDSYYHMAAIYLQDRLALTERLELTAGARATYAKADIGRYENFETTPHTPASFEDDWTDLSGHLRLACQVIDEHWLVYASLSQAYRAPGLYDLTSFNVNRSTDIAIPSPDLDPEKFLGGEIGSRVESRYVAWHIAYFYTDLRDQIISHHIGDNYFSRANSGEGYVHGVETELKLKYTDQWQSRFGFTWMEGYTDYTSTSGEPVHEYIRTLPMSGFATLRWQEPSKRFWVEGVVRAVAKEDRLTANDKRDTQRIPPGGTPGYAVADLRAGWKVNQRLSLVGGVDNVTDKDYRQHGSGSNEAGRNFILSAEYQF